jgi:pyrroline-5-carboxylate reductase
MHKALSLADAGPLLDRIWIVGCGQMGGALLARWLGAGMPADRVTVIDPAPRALPDARGVRLVGTPAEAGEAPTLLILGVKPQTLPDIAEPLLSALGDARPLLLSMLAGVRTQTLADRFPGLAVARMMPNLAVRIGEGATALYAPALPLQSRTALEALLAPTGWVAVLEEEGRFDAVTALSGSGPAFLCRFVEALGGAGEAAGLDRDMAQALALQTMIGTAALLGQSGIAPAALRQQVTSPGGTTEAGLDVLDGDGALSALMRATVRGAAERSRALAAAADAGDPPVPAREAARAG